MKILVGVLFILCLSVSGSFGTAQYGDQLIYKGEEYVLYTNPMEEYFYKHPDKRPQRDAGISALWRGYVATFEFVDSCLALKDIEIPAKSKAKDRENSNRTQSWKSIKRDFVPWYRRFFLDWYTGLLVIPDGELVEYVHMGYGSLYSSYILLEVREGRLVREIRLDGDEYEEFRERQFQKFKEAAGYRLDEEKGSDEGQTLKVLNDFLRGFFSGDYGSIIIDEQKASDETSDSTK